MVRHISDILPSSLGSLLWLIMMEEWDFKFPRPFPSADVDLPDIFPPCRLSPEGAVIQTRMILENPIGLEPIAANVIEVPFNEPNSSCRWVNGKSSVSPTLTVWHYTHQLHLNEFTFSATLSLPDSG
jgi:hypothetical protein